MPRIWAKGRDPIACAHSATYHDGAAVDSKSPAGGSTFTIVAPMSRRMLTATGPVLLVYPGLLARYDQIQLLERLREASGRQHGAPGFIVLIAADEQRHMPVLDGKPIPVILASEWARIPEAWLENVHRGAQQSPTPIDQ